MADDPGRRSEPASPRQLREARRLGRVARSRDLGSWTNLAGVLALLWLGHDFWIRQIHSLAGLGIGQVQTLARTGSIEISTFLQGWSHSMLALTLTVPLTCAALSILVNGCFNRWLFAPAAALPDLNRLDPATNVKRMFAGSNWIELAKSLVKIAILSLGLWLTIIWALPNLVQVPISRSISLPVMIERVLSGFLFSSLAAFGFITLFDLWYQRFRYLRELRVTPEEKKRDQRQDEGDPGQRARRRQLLRELVQESPLERCVHASMIVSSTAQSTAVAIYWEPDSGAAPWLLNKGRHSVGLAIIQIARDHHIRLHEDAELCNRIYRQTGIDADLEPSLAVELGRYR